MIKLTVEIIVLQIESTVMPYLQVLSEFREGVRQIAREKKGESSLFPVLLHMRLGGFRNQTGGLGVSQLIPPLFAWRIKTRHL